jgi:hypothetical protein
VVVCDAAIAAVADVGGTHEVVFAELDVRPVSDRRLFAAPMPGKRKTRVSTSARGSASGLKSASAG